MANYKNSPTSQLNEDKTPKVSRNWHDRSHKNTTSLPVGRVVPVLCEFLQGNSKVKLDINSAVQTNPTASPVFGTMSVDVKSVFCALRHYVVGLYGNNLLENDFVEEIGFPMLALSDVLGRYYAIGQGSLLAHLRYPRVLSSNVSTDILGVPLNRNYSVPLNKKARLLGDELWAAHTNDADGRVGVALPYTEDISMGSMNAIPILAYIDACLHYCVDPFDRVIPFEQTVLDVSAGALTVNRSIVGLEYDSLMNLIYEAKGFSVPDSNLSIGGLDATALYLSPNSISGDASYYSLIPLVESDEESYGGFTAIDEIAQMTFNDGLFPATFKPDLMTSWYDEEQINKLMSVSFDNGSYTGLRLARAEFNRIANSTIKGQTFEDFVDSTYGYNLKMCDHPILVGVDSYHIRFQDIVNTAARMGNGVQEVPLGTAVARGYAQSGLNKTIEFVSQEPGFLLVLASLVPSVAYREDVPHHLKYTKLGDTPNRFYDGASFQSLLVDNVFHTCVEDLDMLSIGSQPFYYQHMISYDRVSGLMATDGFLSYGFIRDFDVTYFPFSSREGFFPESADSMFIDAFRSKYVNGSMFDYPFPANAPLSVGEQYQAIANATAQNYYFAFYFDLRVLEPLTNQVIARATF